MHQLNTESVALPAIALAAGVHLPAGALAPDRAVATLRALATRTLSWGRVHVNVSYAPGKDLAPTDPSVVESDRWSGGIAVDRTFVLRSLLVGAELFARSPLVANADVEWRTGLGVRQQIAPRLAFDAGIQRRVSAGAPGWAITAGAAYAFAPQGTRGFRGGAR